MTDAKEYRCISCKRAAKVLVLSNHNIGVGGDDSDGVLRRLFILPFEYYVPDDTLLAEFT